MRSLHETKWKVNLGESLQDGFCVVKNGEELNFHNNKHRLKGVNMSVELGGVRIFCFFFLKKESRIKTNLLYH